MVGDIVESQGKGQRFELQAQRRPELLGLHQTRKLTRCRRSATHPEFLREIAHLRPRTNTFGAMARVRNAVAYAIHSFFPGARIPVYPDAHHHRQRRRGRRFHVPRHHS